MQATERLQTQCVINVDIFFTFNQRVAAIQTGICRTFKAAWKLAV